MALSTGGIAAPKIPRLISKFRAPTSAWRLIHRHIRLWPNAWRWRRLPGRVATRHLQHRAVIRLQQFRASPGLFHAEHRFCTAVVDDLEGAGAIGLRVGQAMNSCTRAIDRNFQAQAVSGGTPEGPEQLVAISHSLHQLAKFVHLAPMPQNGLAEDKSQGHFIGQGFEGAGRTLAVGKKRVRPGPEVAVPVSAVVALQTEA